MFQERVTTVTITNCIYVCSSLSYKISGIRGGRLKLTIKISLPLKLPLEFDTITLKLWFKFHEISKQVRKLYSAFNQKVVIKNCK